MKTSSMVEKSLNKSFQTSYTFLGASNMRPQFKPRNKHSSILSLKDRVPAGLYLMEIRNTCLTIRKLLVQIVEAKLLKFKFMHTLSKSKSIFVIEQKAIVSCFVKNVAFFWDTR